MDEDREVNMEGWLLPRGAFGYEHVYMCPCFSDVWIGDTHTHTHTHTHTDTDVCLL